MALHRSPQLLGALALLTIFTWLAWDFKRSGNASLRLGTTHSNVEDEAKTPAQVISTPDTSLPGETSLLDTLCHYGVCNLSPDTSITYGRIDLETTDTKAFEAPLLQDIDISFPTLEPINAKDTIIYSSDSLQHTTVETVAPPVPADASNLILGAATNVDRLEDSLGQFSHWASNNGAHIIALLPNTSSPEAIDRTSKKAKALKVDLTILTSELAFDDRYFHLASLMYNYSTSATEWAVFIDDDTFFPSMNNLQTLLSKYPSPQTRPYYVGALSEDFHQLFKWGYMAYGGGGVFVSKSLLHQLNPHLSDCTKLANTGDARLAQCIFSRTTTKLSTETLLHQIDLWGDVSGFYEALRPQPMSVHHWKSWNWFDMVNISRVSAVCSDACIFQKYRLRDGWQLTNGFSLVKYSDGNDRDATDERMEKTWLDSQGGSLDMFLHSLAPLRPRDENKIQYLLEGSILEAGTVRQFYVRRTKEDENPVLQIVEVAWRKGKGSGA